VAVAVPVWVVGALWLEACDCPEPAAPCPCPWFPVCAWALCCAVWLEFVAVLVAAEVFVWFAVLPVAMFVGCCVEVADEVAVCSVGALCTIDWDWPAPAPPPVCVWTLVWLVELSFDDEDEAVFELVCCAPGTGGEPARAAAGWRAAASSSTTVRSASPKPHRFGVNIGSHHPAPPCSGQDPECRFALPPAGWAAAHALP
jgi:hypothetical protein